MSDKKGEIDPKVEKEVERQLKILEFGTTEITPKEEFVKMLRHSISSGTPLRVKCGIDPTSSDVHLGHLVPYRKMRQFQDLGHLGIVIIGDYTASIGDPTGRNESRVSLGLDEVNENAKQYMEQVFTVLDKSKTEIRYQSEWYRDVSLQNVILWASQTTVAKLLSHDTFKNRLDNNQSLSLHEMFYPVLQGIDSVEIKADVELGGSDQKFNVLMGRDYQKFRGMRPQVGMLLPIITGLCGTQKMSKSLANYIGILDEPFDKFGKVMSIPDTLMLEYYQYVANVNETELQEIKRGLDGGTLHPNEAKKQLATMIVAFFHGESVAQEMRAQFERVFKKGSTPDEMPEFEVPEGGITLIDLLVDSKLLATRSEVRRMVKQGAVRFLDGDKIINPELPIDRTKAELVIKVGKRKFLKLI